MIGKQRTDPKAREVYMNEAANHAWSTRFLDEQVDKHYYERLISTHKEALNELNERNLKFSKGAHICSRKLLLYLRQERQSKHD